MKWIKHDTNANQDAKLKRMRMKYGLEGYGLYWYCLEIIAADVDQNKLTFELEHDAEIIAFDTGIHYERVNEMMAYMVNLKLFESNHGVMTCLKLANRLDKSMTSNPMMRKMLGDIKVNHDAVMTQSAEPMQDKTRLDENRIDKTKEEVKQESLPIPAKPKPLPKYTDRDFLFAEEMYKRLLVINPNHKQPNFETWANDIRITRERDSRTLDELWNAFNWANKDSFWCKNILSPGKLREQFDKLTLQMNSPSHTAPQQQADNYATAAASKQRLTDTDW